MMKLNVRATKKVFQGKIFDIRKDQVEMPNGKIANFDILEHPGAVMIVPIDVNNNFWLIEQYRHAVGGKILEFPAGSLEIDEKPILCAHREVQEEIGLKAENMVLLGQVFNAPGYSDEIIHIFLGSDLSPSALPQDEDEIIEPVKYSGEELQRLISDGKIQDAKTIAGFALATKFLEAK